MQVLSIYSSLIEFWWWWILAALFFGLELTLPGAFLLWIGFSATVCGFLFWAIPSFPLATQLLIFSGTSMLSLFIWSRYFKGYTPTSSHPYLNDRAAQLIGTTHVLPEGLGDGIRLLRIHDSYFRIQGPDLPKGASVKVVNVIKGVELVVEEVK